MRRRRRKVFASLGCRRAAPRRWLLHLSRPGPWERAFFDRVVMMGKFDQVTVVAVVGEADGRNAAYSVSRTVAELPGSRGLLIAAGRPAKLPDSIDYIHIDGLDYFQYQMYVVQCLHYHVHTDYALLVRHDGWALNGANWNDKWFEYDYVGGPCHAAGVDGRLCLHYSWVGNPRAIPVLVGGFSLRSRELLEAPTKYGTCYKQLDAPILRFEDIQLCLVLREGLERRGIKFAPLKDALYFAIEYMHPLLHNDVDLSKVFGIHGQTRRLRSDFVVEGGMTQAEIDRTFGEARIIALLEHYGYTVTRKQHPG